MKGTALVFLGPVCVRVALRPCGGRVWPPVAETPCYASVANRASIEGQNRQAIEATSKGEGFWGGQLTGGLIGDRSRGAGRARRRQSCAPVW